jgi:hypothetical protein
MEVHFRRKIIPRKKNPMAKKRGRNTMPMGIKFIIKLPMAMKHGGNTIPKGIKFTWKTLRAW